MSRPDRGAAEAAGSRSAATGNHSPQSLDLFERSWQVYHRLVADDLMEHAGLQQALAERLEAFLGEAGDAPLTMADLACGDLTTLEPLLRCLPLAGFTAVDAAAATLPLARGRMQGWSVPCQWIQEDLLRWADQDGECYSLITCLFGLHHLADPDKQRFLERVGGRLAEGGLLLIGDVFRVPGEDRPSFLQRYVRRIRDLWTDLEAHHQDHVVAHMESSDYPADREVFVAMAHEAGWRAEWLWNGSHSAEALLALQRAD